MLSEQPTGPAIQMWPSAHRPLALTLALIVLVGCAAAPESEVAAPSEVAAVHVQTFEKVWTEIRDNYFDPTFGGLDWDAIGDRYRVELRDVTSDSALHALLNRMLKELGKSHLGVISPDAYEPSPPDTTGAAPAARPKVDKVDKVDGAAAEKSGGGSRSSAPPSSKKRGGVGLEAAMVEGHPTIVSVRDGGAAHVAGLRPGFVLVRIGGREVGDAIARLVAAGRDDASIVQRMERFIAERLTGAAGSSVDVAYLDEDNAEHEVSLVREPDDRRRVAILNLPPTLMECDVRTLEGGVGYVSFSIFFLQLMKEIREGILSFRGAPGLILDLRGNGGGMAMMSVSVAALILGERVDLGTMRNRTSVMRFPVFPVSDPVRAPVVVLVDGGTGSTSEMLAGALQEMGRVRVVGTTSAGMVLPSLLKTLPTGARLQYPMADFLTAKGRALEGTGVIPDFVVPRSRASLLRGQDNVVEAARKLLLGSRSRSERNP